MGRVVVEDSGWRKVEVVLEWILARAEEGADPKQLMRNVLVMIKEQRWKALDDLFRV